MSNDCPFKSAKELGLKQAEWEALITTLILMENGAIQHVPYKEIRIAPYLAKKIKKDSVIFNMAEWNSSMNCGSVCCIGGSAELFGGLRAHTMERRADTLADQGDENLHALFFDWIGDPTPQQAAKVLRGYLKTGETNWWKVMG